MMAKMVGRIPANQIHQVNTWRLPTLNPDNGETNKVFKLMTGLTQGRLGNFDKSVKAKPRSKPRSGEETQTGESIKVSAESTGKDDLEAGSSATPEDSQMDDVDENEAPLQPVQDPPAGEISSTDSEEEISRHAEEAYADGFKKGEAEGLIQGEAKGIEAGKVAAEEAFSQEVADQRALIQGLQEAFKCPPDTSAIVQSTLASLITSITEVVVLNELKTDPELIAKLISTALAALPHGVSKVQVSVNPADMDNLSMVVDELDTSISYVADASIVKGGCKVTSDTGVVDASLSKRINECLIQALKNEDIESTSDIRLQETHAALSDDVPDKEPDA